jgi:hypothetical protein
LWKQVKAQQLQIANICMKMQIATWYPLTDCQAFAPYVQSKIQYVDRLRDITADYLPTPSERVKRGILNLGGNILKFLFGTLTQSDAQKYTEHIQKLEDEQQSFLRISQEQMTVLKSAILSFNIAMQKVNQNEKILNENLLRLSKMVVDEINHVQAQLDSILILNENIQQIQRT